VLDFEPLCPSLCTIFLMPPPPPPPLLLLLPPKKYSLFLSHSVLLVWMSNYLGHSRCLHAFFIQPWCAAFLGLLPSRFSFLSPKFPKKWTEITSASQGDLFCCKCCTLALQTIWLALLLQARVCMMIFVFGMSLMYFRVGTGGIPFCEKYEKAVTAIMGEIIVHLIYLVPPLVSHHLLPLYSLKSLFLNCAWKTVWSWNLHVWG